MMLATSVDLQNNLFRYLFFILYKSYSAAWVWLGLLILQFCQCHADSIKLSTCNFIYVVLFRENIFHVFTQITNALFQFELLGRN